MVGYGIEDENKGWISGSIPSRIIETQQGGEGLRYTIKTKGLALGQRKRQRECTTKR